MTFGARARIWLDAIRQNLKTIREQAEAARVMAVVKANAYGHGIVPVARALDGVDALAVARMSEAKTLREAGIGTPIILLGGLASPDDLVDAANLDVELAFHDEEQIRWLTASGKTLDSAWIKVDTGMHRLGLLPESVGKAVEALGERVGHLKLLTHFASADEAGNPATSEQMDRFLSLAGHFDGDVSVANSAAVTGWKVELERLTEVVGSDRIWIRPGLALYGLSPLAGRSGSELGLVPAMQLESRLLSVKRIPAGACVGYGGTWEADSATTLGVVAAGYGDGYSRYIPTGTPVLVNERRVPVVGRVSMDLTAVDLGPDASDQTGDPVILWGPDLPVEEIAAHAGTIPYQLVTGVTHREPPIYEGHS